MNRFNQRLAFSSKITPKIINLLTKIDEYKSYWRAFQKLSPDFLSNLKKTVIISSTGSSTRIEGSSLSDEQIEKIIYKANLTNNLSDEFSTRDKQEVAGYLEIIKHIFSAYKTIPFTEGTILQLHEMSLHYSEKDQLHKGKYKSESNKVILVKNNVQKGVLFDPTPPHLVKGEMIELLEWTRNSFVEKKYHPLLIIGNFIFEYLSIHPFKDGNGRTSRLLTNLLLLHHGYEFTPYVSHEKIIEENNANYYLALRKSSQNWKTKNDHDISAWLIFFLKVVEIQGQRAEKITTKEDPEDFLSLNQRVVWRCFAKKSDWSRKELFEKTGVNIKTVEQVLKKLLGMRKIRRVGMGRGTRYTKF
jgi:Fic family protein